MQKSLQLTCLTVLLIQAAAELSCLNRNGKPVDWFVALKVPDTGLYSYCDSNNCEDLKQVHGNLNTLSESPVKQTLKQIQNSQSQNVGSIFWNDQIGKKHFGNNAHAKGFMGFDQSQGFLMVHSAPKFPLIENDRISLDIDSSQLQYGQHFFCVTASINELERIAEAYTLDYPNVYHKKIPPFFAKFTSLNKLSQNLKSTNKISQTVSFSSPGKTNFLKFARQGNQLNQIRFYENIVAHQLKVDLIVESWDRPQEDLFKCKYSVWSCNEVKLGEINFTSTKDHSKYAVSQDDNQPFVCFGDVNRTEAQIKRGGGTVCFKNQKLQQLLKQAMHKHQQNSGNRPTNKRKNPEKLPDELLYLKENWCNLKE